MGILGQIILVLAIITIPIIVISVLYKRRIKQEKIAWYESKKNVVLSILVPKENEKKPVAAEQLFASLHGIFRTENKFQDQVSFEIVSKDKYIQFYVFLPEYLKDFVEGQIYAQYPDVEIYQVPDYTKEDFTDYSVAATHIKLAKPEVYSIKTFASFEVDPLAAITAVMSKVDEDEQIWIQIIIRPVSDAWQIRGISHVAAVRAGSSGESFKIKNIGKILLGLISEIFKSLFFSSNPEASSGGVGGGEAKLSGPEEEALKEIERKSTKLGFATKIKIVSLSKNQYKSRTKLESVVGALKQFSTTNLNSFEAGKITTSLTTVTNYRKRSFYNEGYILNIEELASLYHLPTTAVETPNIVWAGSKKGEPPSNLPVLGTVETDNLTLLAKTDFRNIEKTFGIKRRDRGLHMYIVGKTGTGKSTLLENMVIDDIKKGQGVCYIDPHGDAIENIIRHIPEERIKDVIYFNPADKEWPVGFNPLESVDPELKNIVASGVVGIFKKIFGESWGPRLEYILRNALLACVDHDGSTLLSVMRLLTDASYRKRIISKIEDPVVKDFFNNEFDKYDPKFQREAIAPIQNKVGQFLSSSTIRNIVGQPKSTIDLAQIMDTRKILLVDLSVGKIGEDSSSLLGAMLITKFQLAAMQRAKIDVNDRKDFYLYVDEFQNFATDSFAVILSEARKYKLNLTMTNQYIAQMPETVAKAIFGNVGTIISFRVGAQDANALVKEFEPVFMANDMINLNNYNIYVKMAIDGVTRPAFSAITLPLEDDQYQGNREKIISFSREQYSKSRDDVESEIKRWNEEATKSRLEEEERVMSRKRPRRFGGVETTYKQIEHDGYYTFVDQSGQKWYIPRAQEGEEGKSEPNKDLKDTKETKDSKDSNGAGESKDSGKPVELKKTISAQKISEKAQGSDDIKKDEKQFKFGPMIEPELNKDLSKITNKINSNNVSDDLLVSIEELEKFLDKKDE